MLTPAFAFTHVRKVYAKGAPVVALDDISLSVRPGACVAVMGPSGSGKSTLLNLVGGLDTPTSGSVSLGGVDVGSLTEARRSILRRSAVAYVFQAYHLLPTLTCEQNVAMPLYLRGRSSAQVSTRVSEALRAVGLLDRARHLPEELSGGERQRAAIARALVIEPAVLLADEPTGNLDSVTGAQVLTLLYDVTRVRGATLVMVTHNEDAARRCDRLIRLRDGRIEADSGDGDV